MQPKSNAIKFKSVCAMILGAVFFSPVVLLAQSELAQSDPMATPASQTQANRPQQAPASATSMQDSAANSGDVGQTMKDKIFLRKAAQGGMAEVKLGQLAAEKGSSEEVKTFGQKMVDDHTQLNNEMAPIADSMGVRMPKNLNKEDQAEYDKLSGLSGNDFDMEYLSAMVKDHHKDLREFRAEAASTTDPTLQAAVTKATKVIHEHSVMVDKLAREKGVPMPQRGGGSPAPSF
jgi:putative membrane protein